MKINDKFLTFLKGKKKWIIIIFALLLLWGLIQLFSTKKLLHSPYYSIARNVNWYPLQLMNRERNLQGLVDDLMATIAKEEDFKYNWIETGPSTLLEGLENGSYDAILTFTRPTGMTKEKYAFSTLIYETGPVLIVPENSKINSLNDLDGKVIGMHLQTTFIFNIIGKTPAETNYILSPFENMSKALDMLVNDKIDAVIMDAVPAHSYIQTFYPGKLKIVTAPLTDEGLRLISLNNPSSEILIKKFNNGLKKLKNNGTFEKLLSKWQLVDPESYRRTESK